MIITNILDEDFVNYKKISMNVLFPQCSFKCDKECGIQVCYNKHIIDLPKINISPIDIVNRYCANPLSEALVCIGLEPFDSWDDLQNLIKCFRNKTTDDIIIYTGYNENELSSQIIWLQQFPNIIVKFGRYLPNQSPHLDPILQVKLASNNQYAKQIS